MSSAMFEQAAAWLGGRNPRSAAREREGLFKFSNLTPRVQGHLSQVYATLAVACLVSALGCYTDMMLGIPGFLTQIGAFGCLLALNWTPPSPRAQSKRFAYLGGFAFCQGAAMGPLVNLAIALAPAALVTACATTAAVFVAFSLSALMTKRRSYLYLGGYLAAATSAMLVMRLGGWLFGAQALVYSVELYGGLLLFSAYILYDTQLIVERCACGEDDVVRHALDLLVDVLAVFVRVLVLLMKRAEEEKRREDDRRRKR